jgi:hypothetical protein
MDFTRDYTRRRMDPPTARLDAVREQMVVQFSKFAGRSCDEPSPLADAGDDDGQVDSQRASQVRGSHSRVAWVLFR